MDDKRFELIYKEGSAMTTERTLILRDRETGAEYLFVQSGYAGGLHATAGRGRKADRQEVRKPPCSLKQSD